MHRFPFSQPQNRQLRAAILPPFRPSILINESDKVAILPVVGSP